jgi:cytochrome c-type biogenesis protein CcmF
MLLAHLGVAVFVVGVTLVKGYESEKDVKMQAGDTVEVGGYTFRMDEIRNVKGPNYLADRGTVRILDDADHVIGTLHPEKRRYASGGQVMTEAGIAPGITGDLYVALGEPLGDDTWAVRVHRKPFVRWIWFGAALMALGGFVTATDRRFRRKEVAA